MDQTTQSDASTSLHVSCTPASTPAPGHSITYTEVMQRMEVYLVLDKKWRLDKTAACVLTQESGIFSRRKDLDGVKHKAETGKWHSIASREPISREHSKEKRSRFFQYHIYYDRIFLQANLKFWYNQINRRLTPLSEDLSFNEIISICE